MYPYVQKCTLFSEYKSIKTSTIDLVEEEIKCLIAHYDKDIAEKMHRPGEIWFSYENVLVKIYLDSEKNIGCLDTLLKGLTFEYLER